MKTSEMFGGSESRKDLCLRPECSACCEQARSSPVAMVTGSVPSPVSLSPSGEHQKWLAEAPRTRRSLSAGMRGLHPQRRHWLYKPERPRKDHGQQQQMLQGMRTMTNEWPGRMGWPISRGKQKTAQTRAFPHLLQNLATINLPTTYTECFNYAFIICDRGPTSFVYPLDNIYLDISSFSVIFSAQCCYKMRLANNSI